MRCPRYTTTMGDGGGGGGRDLGEASLGLCVLLAANGIGRHVGREIRKRLDAGVAGS